MHSLEKVENENIYVFITKTEIPQHLIIYQIWP